MNDIPTRLTRRINEGWITYSDGRKVPVYWQSSMYGHPAKLEAWSDEMVARYSNGPHASPQRISRWEQECALTKELLAGSEDGRIRAIIVRGGYDQPKAVQNAYVGRAEFKLQGSELVMTFQDNKHKGSRVDAWLLELLPEPGQ